MTDRHPTAWLLGTPTAILAACYLIVGEWWVAVGIAALVGLVALGAALSDTLQKLAAVTAENDMRGVELAATERAMAELLAPKSGPIPLHTVRPGEVGYTARDLRVVPPQRSDSWLEDVVSEQMLRGDDGDAS